MDSWFPSKKFRSLSREVIDSMEKAAHRKCLLELSTCLPRMEEIKMVFAWGSAFRTEFKHQRHIGSAPFPLWKPRRANQTSLLSSTWGKLRIPSANSPACKNKEGSGGGDHTFTCMPLVLLSGSLFLALWDYISELALCFVIGYIGLILLTLLLSEVRVVLAFWDPGGSLFGIH